MSFLLQYKAYLIGGGAIIFLLLLANYFENQGIREDEGDKWRTQIREARVDTVEREVIKIVQAPVTGTARSERVFIAPTVPDEIIDSMDYYRWVTQPYTVFVNDTSGAELDMTAIPLQSEIKYTLKLPPKEIQYRDITKTVLEPAISRNFLFGLSLEYHGEPGIGAMIGIKPLTFGATYYKDSKLLYRVGVQFEF